MRQRLAFVLLSLLLIGGVAQAQEGDGDCGNGVPCGAIPWAVPRLPDLQSPTPYPTVVVTLDATDEPTPDVTDTAAPPTATPYATPIWDATQDIDEPLATIQGILDGTDEPIIGGGGAEFTFETIGTELDANVTLFFGYVRGVTGASFGVLTPMINFIFLVLVTVFFVAGLKLTLPVLGAVIGFLRKLIQLILEFIPG